MPVLQVYPMIIDTLSDSLRKVFRVQLAMPLEINIVDGESEKREAPENTQVAGFMKLASSNYEGTLALCFSLPVFLAVAGRMIREHVTSITPANVDTAAEILNMTFGSVKVKMNALGHDFQMAIPQTLQGDQLGFKYDAAARFHRLECHVSSGKFFADLAIKEIELE
jgi:CheY-specific phosphatase CheX